MADCGGCASPRERYSGQDKLYPTTAVRYGRMGYIGEFSQDANERLTCGAKVIIQTDRGIEIGEQVRQTCAGCDRAVTRDKMRSFARESGAEAYRINNGRILREATESDLAEQRHLETEVFDKIKTCRQLAEQLELPMKIVDAEHIFGGERIIFYFMSEDRVDFRELVRLLAREFQTRIEMRQVGARDEARLLADYETCGRECCCKNFLKTLKPIGMQMAKLQKATLDPSKVSGRCGRLKCCLRYEHESYAELNKRLPRTGRRVRTASEEGVVIDRQILTQLLRLRKDDGTIVTIREEDIVERDLPNPPPIPQGEGEPNGNRRPNSRPDRRRSGQSDSGGRPGRDRTARPAENRGSQPRPPKQEEPEEEPADLFDFGEPSAAPPPGELTADAAPAMMPESGEDQADATEPDLAEEPFGPVEDEAGDEDEPQREGETPAGEKPSGTAPGRGRRRNRNRRRRRRNNGGNRPGSPG